MEDCLANRPIRHTTSVFGCQCVETDGIASSMPARSVLAALLPASDEVDADVFVSMKWPERMCFEEIVWCSQTSSAAPTVYTNHIACVGNRRMEEMDGFTGRM